MPKAALLFFGLLLSNFWSLAQIVPEPGARLNYTQVMFEYENVKGANAYLLQIIEDTTGASFAKPLIEQKDSSTATLINGLQFGKKYQWRYTGLTAGGKPVWRGPYHFEILNIDSGNRNAHAIIVVKNDGSKNAGGLVAADCYTIVNRKGEPVWFLPESKERDLGALRDLRLTPFGTVTFLTGLPLGAAYECDLKGNVLWKAPDDGKLSGDTAEFYHHDFQRLPNGNYMTLGNKFVWKKIPEAFIMQAKGPGAIPGSNRLVETSGPLQAINRAVNGEVFTKIQFGTIIEYNSKKEIVWSWNSESYFSDSDIFQVLPGKDSSGRFIPSIQRDAHLNAFTIDPKDEFVYAGFKDINRLIKIEKRTGKVVSIWDATLPGAGFYHQHGATLRSDGSLMIFDNANFSEAGKPSRVLALTQPSNQEEPKISWQFNCEFDSLIAKSDKGGNADELPNKNILVCMGIGLQERMKGSGTPAPVHDGRIFEVTREKQLVWSAVVEGVQSPYRAHYTSSLYPCYFTFQADGESFKQNLSLTIYNEGSEADSYTIQIRFKKAGLTQQINCATVSAGGSGKLQLKPVKLPVSDDSLEITVSSNTNTGFVRKRIVPFKR